MNVAVFYNSLNLQSLASAAYAITRYPQATKLDTRSLNEAGITALIATLAATSQNRIYIFCVTASTHTGPGVMTDAQATSVNGKMVTGTATKINVAAGGKTAQQLAYESAYNTTLTRPLICQYLGGGGNSGFTVSDSGTASAGTTTTLTSPNALVANALVGQYLYITGGAQAGQARKVLSNTTSVITVDTAFQGAINNTSVFEVRSLNIGNGMIAVNAYGLASAGTSTTLTLRDTTTTNSFAGKYLAIVAGTNSGQIRKIVSNTTTVVTVDKPFPAANDNTSVYRIVTYTVPGQELHEYFAPLYILANMRNLADPQTELAWNNIIDQGGRFASAGTGSPIQDFIYLTDTIIAGGEIVYNYNSRA